MTFENKIILVTGASRGIGADIALSFAKLGGTVIGTATSQAGADSISSALKEFGGEGIVMNVCDTDSIHAAVDYIIEKYQNAPQILINNAGITKDNVFLRLSAEDWESVINTNLTGAFKVIKYCAKFMVKARWGRIINISSVVGLTGNPGQANYVASKAGMIGLTKTVALELGSRGITVNAVAPGFIETDMTNQLSLEQKEALVSKVPLKTVGKPSDISHAVTFLASEHAGYITGETLNVNGGLYMA